jgi:CO/xanthine dehydrogenase FAD-binding subunit
VAAWARFAQGGVVDDVRIILGAVGSFPRAGEEAGEIVRGNPLTDDIMDAAARAAARPAKPLDNTDFTIGWRKDMVPVYVRRALAALR